MVFNLGKEMDKRRRKADWVEREIERKEREKDRIVDRDQNVILQQHLTQLIQKYNSNPPSSENNITTEPTIIIDESTKQIIVQTSKNNITTKPTNIINKTTKNNITTKETAA